MARDDVIDFLARVAYEGTGYYFKHWTTPDHAESLAREAGVSKKKARAMYHAAQAYIKAEAELNNALVEIAKEFDIPPGEVELEEDYLTATEED